MIERDFVAQKIKEQQIQEFIKSTLKGAGLAMTKVQRTPLGERIVIYASRPGLVVGRKGQNINKLTDTLKKKFKLDNPQIELNEVSNPNLDPYIIGEKIANTLERYGTTRFKGVGHKTMTEVMQAGGLGIEITISGKIPSARAKSWRFYQGYIKKSGDMAIEGVKVAKVQAKLKSGTVGVIVKIMPPDIKLPDKITIKDVQDAPVVAAEKAEGTEKGKEEAAGKGEEKEAKKKPAKRKPKKAKSEPKSESE